MVAFMTGYLRSSGSVCRIGKLAAIVIASRGRSARINFQAQQTQAVS